MRKTLWSSPSKRSRSSPTLADAETDRLLGQTNPDADKPFFSGDSSYSVPGEGMPDPYGPHLKDQRERARVSIEFAEKAFSRPDFVGFEDGDPAQGFDGAVVEADPL